MNGKRLAAFLIAIVILGLTGALRPSVTPPELLKSVFPGRVQEMRVSDDYLVVHSVEGNVHKVTCLKEPEATFLWEKSFRSMSSPHNIHVYGDRVAVVAAAGDPSATVGLHIYNAATGAEIAYFRDGIFAAAGNRIVGSDGGSGEVYDLAGGTKVFAYSPQRPIRFKAVIGGRVLYLVREGGSQTPWFPLLVSLPGESEAWRGKTFSAEALDFFDHEMAAADDIIRDGFPAFFAGKPRSRGTTPFPLLLLDADGSARLFSPSDFAIPEPAHSLAVRFSYSWISGGIRGVVSGLDTGHLRTNGGEELVLASLDAAGGTRGRASLSLRDNRVLWSGYSPAGGLLLLLQRSKPKSAFLFVSYRIPDLTKTYEKELGFIRATPGPGRLIGDEAFVAGNTAVGEQTVLSLKAADGGLSAFYPFPENPFFLQTAPEEIFGVYNGLYHYVPVANRKDPRQTIITRIPRGSPGWFEGSVSAPSPVYTNTSVNVAYSPSYGVLSAGGGTLSGSVWTAPSVPGTYTITLSVGTAIKECSVQVVEPPPNSPPVADFKVVDPTDATLWNLTAGYDASASRDPDGKIVNYAWDFGDLIKVDGADKVQVWHYAPAGTYDVTLTVTDDDGATAKKTRKVVVGRLLTYSRQTPENADIPPALASGTTANYQIQVLTGGQGGAETSASVFLALYGPVDSEGMRQGSGEFRLDATTSPYKTVPFRKNAVDVFSVAPPGNLPGIAPAWSLDDVAYLTLRHDNTNDSPDWYCYGIRITNQKNGKTWVFVPDQWLDFAKGPHKRPWDKFLRVDETYPGGIYLGGAGEPRCESLIKASDNIFILPASMTKFYFTMLDRSRALDVKRDGQSVGTVDARGSGLLDPKFLRKTEWGVSYQAAQIIKPTKFDVTLGSGSGAKKSVVWIFPSSWADRPDLARKAALALPLKNNLGTFDYGVTARNRLQGLTINIDTALAPIIGYGSQALAIFGDIPDLSLLGYAETAVGQYVDLRLALIAAKLSIEFASDMTSSLKDLLTSIKKALEWASGMGDAIRQGEAASYSTSLLQIMATGKVVTDSQGNKHTSGNGAFLVAVDMLQAIKGKMEAAITAADGNNLAAFQSNLDVIEGIVLGPTAGMTPAQISAAPDLTSFYITYADYGVSYFDSDVKRGFPLLLELAFQLRLVEKAWKTRNEYAPYFYDAGNLYNLDAELNENQKKDATVTAMETYGPIIKDMIKIAGLAANIVLMN